MSLTSTQRNFHVPLPDEVHRQLREEAARRRLPATTLARQAIENWLEQRRAETLHEEIAAYAARHAATQFDLDEELQAAGIELLNQKPKKRAARSNKKVGTR
jgi:predicted transcriptional regulator